MLRSALRLPSLLAALAVPTVAAAQTAPPAPPEAAAPLPGRLGTLSHGVWQCGLPGDATGPAFDTSAGPRFKIINGSGYRTSATERGTYLLVGTRVVFTRGSLDGWQFDIETPSRLRALATDGRGGRMRCNRVGSADAEL